MISAVSHRGEMQFMVFDGTMNVDIFRDFMTRPVKDSPCRVFPIVDNLRVHHAKILDTWPEENSRKIKLFCFTRRKCGMPLTDTDINPGQRNKQPSRAIANKPALRWKLARAENVMAFRAGRAGAGMV